MLDVVNLANFVDIILTLDA